LRKAWRVNDSEVKEDYRFDPLISPARFEHNRRREKTMAASRRIARVLLGSIALAVVAGLDDRPVEATAPSGVTFTLLNRATVPEFDARRKFRQERDDSERDRPRARWLARTFAVATTERPL
jgi:hypothetical protein